jgi:hypothetical protein
MSTLHALQVTPSHLSAAAQDLVVAIRGNSCAWKVHRGWRTKRPGKDFQPRTGEGLIRLQLAMVHTGKGSPRLVLTGAGEEMASVIQEKRAVSQRRKQGAAA